MIRYAGAALLLLALPSLALGQESPDSGWKEHTVAAGVEQFHSIAAADMDGDGDADILAASVSSGIYWYENAAGDGSVWNAKPVAPEEELPLWIAAADMDGDGDRDALVASNRVAWFENRDGKGGEWEPHVIADNMESQGATCVAAADVDGDGHQDVMAVTFAAGFTWYENTSGKGTSWKGRSFAAGGDAPGKLVAADMDGDGDPDAVLASLRAKRVVWYENRGKRKFLTPPHAINPQAGGLFSIGTGDLDGDGDPDVLLAYLKKSIAWHENAGGDGKAWKNHEIESTARGSQPVITADVDGDGNADVLTQGRDGRIIAWHRNIEGDGTAWTETPISAPTALAQSFHAADVDGDGDPDLLVAAYEGDKILWYENSEGR